MLAFRDYKAGDILCAADLNWLRSAVRALAKITGDGSTIFVAQDLDGTTISAQLDETWWIEVAGGNGAGAYAWSRVISNGIGGWDPSPGGETGTTTKDPAYEANGNALVASGTYVPAWREPASNALMFELGTCSS